MRTFREICKIIMSTVLLLGFLITMCWFFFFGTSDKVQEILMSNFRFGLLLWGLLVLGWFLLSNIYFNIIDFLFTPESKEERLRSIKLSKIRKDFRKGKISDIEKNHRKRLVKIEELQNQIKELKGGNKWD